MRISETWLREWVDPPVSTAELAAQLTMAGLEVGAVDAAAPEFSKVVVGEVTQVEPHPDADKLRVCQVNTGSGKPLTIVCGAPNVHVGMKAPVALEGGALPGGMSIKRTRLRGVESAGMLCSARELGLSDHQQGLLELPSDAPVGADLRTYLQLDDAIIEIDLTPNRGDCLGVAGIAREVAVLNRLTIGGPAMTRVAGTSSDKLPVEVQAPAACPRYLGRVITGVDPAAVTPMWMQERLRRSGLRSLGPLVDVTNYVLLELGQPMHAFDLAQLQGGIRVRMANKNEKLTLLDGSEITLETDTLVIADRARVLALAGIMGGENSGVGADTKAIFLECAHFSPDAIAGRARRYGLQTDSSYRFERGVDPELCYRAIERATALLLDICGGQAAPVIDVSSIADLPVRKPIVLRGDRLQRLLGVMVDAEEVTDILGRLGMAVKPQRESWQVTPPSYRFDISIEPDLIEEIARVRGYDSLPSTRPKGAPVADAVSERLVDPDRIPALLTARGYQECITYSFVDAAAQQLIDPDRPPIVLANPIAADLAVMRTSLWPGLLQVLRHNRARQQGRVRVFEQGLRFIRYKDEIKQENMISGLSWGGRYMEQWGESGDPADFFDVKGDVEALLHLTGAPQTFAFRAARHPALHPGQSAEVVRDREPVGWLGRLHPGLAETLEVPADTHLFELSVEKIIPARQAHFSEISRYPSIRRDLALLVRADTKAEAVGEAIRSHSAGLLQDLILFDVYQGPGIESGRKSLAFGLILQDSSRTLTDDDVGAVLERITAHLEQQFGAQLRE